jgi:E3 ubiquitin-protein ligase HECTD2
MRPWSSRLLSPSSRNEPGPNPVDTNAASPARPRSRVTETDILENAYGIPSLPPPHSSNSASRSSKPTRTASHGRSMSHPFPSLFSAKKKKKHGETPAAEFESTDDDATSAEVRRNVAQHSPGKQKIPDKDLMTGKCMTCDSMVRWPKELKVFRCTVCLTINDLKPVILGARRGDGHRAPIAAKVGIYSGEHITPKGMFSLKSILNLYSSEAVSSLSLEKTRQIVDHCITTYLRERLRHDKESISTPVSSPPRSPVRDNRQDDSGFNIPITRASGAEQFSGQTPPIQLPSRAIRQMEEYTDFRETVQPAFSQGSSGPYSKSSPGGVFDTHMAQRNGNLGGSRSTDGVLSRFQDDYSAEGMKDEPVAQKSANVTKNLFKPLQDYIIASFGSFECVNSSFSTVRPHMVPRAASEGTKQPIAPPPSERYPRNETQLSEMDAKTLLLGDFAENGSWWAGERAERRSPERARTQRPANSHESVTLKSPRIDWSEMIEWYNIVLDGGRYWQERLDDLTVSGFQRPSDEELEEIEDQVVEAQSHAQRVLLKATESLLKRPGRLLSEPNDLRFLLIILANPLLYPGHSTSWTKERSRSRSKSRDRITLFNLNKTESTKQSMPSSIGETSNTRKGSSGQHSGIIKRILGLLSNVSNECHHHLVSWFARYSDVQFQKAIDLIGSFVTYRLTRQHGKKREVDQDPTAGLIPSISGPGRNSSAALHAVLGVSSQPSKRNDGKPKSVIYNDDWQIKAAARVMALFFSANNSGLPRRGEVRPLILLEGAHSAGLAARDRAHNHGQIVPTSDFYNTLLDYTDLIADFEAWESKRGKFSFCQYPFFLSIWAKIQIMEHDARRQMEVKAREAFFDSIMTRKTVNQYLVLKIRRECLVEDSLKGVSEVVGTGGEEIKKGLRIEFKGEEGIDAGGLRKEWFLLLVRDVFNPEHGMMPHLPANNSTKINN